MLLGSACVSMLSNNKLTNIIKMKQGNLIEIDFISEQVNEATTYLIVIIGIILIYDKVK